MSNRSTAIAACAVVLSLAGCGNTYERTTPLAEPPPTVSSSAPRGDELTPTATELAFGEPARMMYDATTVGEEKTKIALVPVSVTHGPISDFEDVNLDEEERSKEYFYVTMSATNLGPLPLDPVFMLYVKVRDTAHKAMTRIHFLTGGFTPCETKPTDTLAVGATFTTCEVYVAPEGQDVSEVAFVVPEGLYEEYWVAWPPR